MHILCMFIREFNIIKINTDMYSTYMYYLGLNTAFQSLYISQFTKAKQSSWLGRLMFKRNASHEHERHNTIGMQ